MRVSDTPISLRFLMNYFHHRLGPPFLLKLFLQSHILTLTSPLLRTNHACFYCVFLQRSHCFFRALKCRYCVFFVITSRSPSLEHDTIFKFMPGMKQTLVTVIWSFPMFTSPFLFKVDISFSRLRVLHWLKVPAAHPSIMIDCILHAQKLSCQWQCWSLFSPLI